MIMDSINLIECIKLRVVGEGCNHRVSTFKIENVHDGDIGGTG